MGICRPDIPVARQDFTATRAAPLPYYATLVSCLTQLRQGSSSLGTLCLLGQWSRGIGLCLITQSSADPIACFHQSKHVPVHTKSSESDWLLIFLITTNCYETERMKAARTKQFNRGINYGRT
jgi:hypothetical protein